MKKTKKIFMNIILLGFLLSTTGCIGMTKKATASLTVSANLQKDKDFVILNDVKGEGSNFYVLGFPFGQLKEYAVLGSSSYYSSIEEMAANYEAIKSVEEADAILPTLIEKKVTLFYPIFGRSTVTVEGKALKIK